MIFRKEGDIELRHQRNPDCVFDYIRPRLPGIMSKVYKQQDTNFCTIDEVTEKKPPFMYGVIETLLPKANYNSETNPNGEKMIELYV